MNWFNQIKTLFARGSQTKSEPFRQVIGNEGARKKQYLPQSENMERLVAEVAYACEGNPEELPYDELVALYKCLVSSTVYLPTPPKTGEDEDLVEFLTVQNDTGDLGIPVFSSETTLGYWYGEHGTYAEVPFPALCAQVLKAGADFIVLNPAGPHSGEISSFELSYLAEGLIPPRVSMGDKGIVLEPDTEISLAKPGQPVPDLLMERIKGLFSRNRDKIDAAYVFEVSIAHGPMHLAMGVRMLKGFEQDWENDILPNTLAISQEVLGKNEYIDFFLLNESSELEKSIQQVAIPIFTISEAV